MKPRRAINLAITILLALVAYLFGRRIGHKKGMYDQWYATEWLNSLIWNGTGLTGGFEGLKVKLNNE